MYNIRRHVVVAGWRGGRGGRGRRGGRARAARALRHAADPGPERHQHLRGPQHQHVQRELRIAPSGPRAAGTLAPLATRHRLNPRGRLKKLILIFFK